MRALLTLFLIFIFTSSPSSLIAERPEFNASPQNQPTPSTSTTPDEADSLVVPDGTPIRLKVLSAFSSANAKVGDAINFAVAFEVRESGLVIIPQRTSLAAKVLSVSHPRRGNRSGQVMVAYDALTLPTGDTATVPILKPSHAAKKAAYGAAYGAGAASWVFATAGFGLVDIFGKGPEQVVSEGNIVVVYLNGPVRMSRKSIVALQPALAPDYVNIFVEYPRWDFHSPRLFCGERSVSHYKEPAPLRLQLRVCVATEA